MFALVTLALAPIAFSALLSPVSAPSEAPLMQDVGIEIQVSNDHTEALPAWAALDSLSPSALGEYALGNMRVSYVGTTPSGFATEALFTVEDSDTTYVFAKSPVHTDNVPLSTFSVQEQTTLTNNLPECDEDFTNICIDLSTNTFNV